jgi:hypothetical protein
MYMTLSPVLRLFDFRSPLSTPRTSLAYNLVEHDTNKHPHQHSKLRNPKTLAITSGTSKDGHISLTIRTRGSWLQVLQANVTPHSSWPRSHTGSYSPCSAPISLPGRVLEPGCRHTYTSCVYMYMCTYVHVHIYAHVCRHTARRPLHARTQP